MELSLSHPFPSLWEQNQRDQVSSVTGPSTLKHVQDPSEALCEVMASLERVCGALITG